MSHGEDDLGRSDPTRPIPPQSDGFGQDQSGYGPPQHHPPGQGGYAPPPG